MRSILAFSDLIQDKINFKKKYYPEENHGTLPLIAEYDALRFMFSWYAFTNWGEFYNPESQFSAEELVDLIVKHYDQISAKMGYKVYPKESEINRLAYLFLGWGESERALAFFNLNLKNYPESANAYDSMGDYYVSKSDSDNAIKCFSKSIELGGVPGTKEKLAKLKAEK